MTFIVDMRFQNILKETVFTLCCLFIGMAIQAQDSDLDRVKCHTYEMQEKLFEERPELKIEAEKLQREFDLRVRDLPNGTFNRKDGEPYIIPVVFHIIHDNGAENISNEQVMDAVREMTLDFNAENLDLPLVNQAFADIAGDVGIEFRLARLDPQGNCTNGIVRTLSSKTYSGGENLKIVSPIWDRSRYMNVWVCRSISNGAAGYTYYPSSLNGSFGETNDGIVVRSDYVGGIGTSSGGKRHTLTHEVGHWINLAHVWGSTNDPGVASNCDTDDGVEDTPNTIGWTTCNISGQSCGSLDNVENFMEYAYCSKMFTEGQKTRMLASVNDVIAMRSSLWQEENLIFTGVYNAPELCEADFTSGRRTICVGESVNFSDESFWGVAERNWIFDGGYPAGSILATPSVTYNTPGKFAVALLVSDTMGNTQSKVEPSFIHVLDPGIIPFPQIESFEEADPGPDFSGIPWFEDGNANIDRWTVTDEAAFTGQKSARILDTDPQEGVRRYLSSQNYSLADLDGIPVLTFKYAAAAKTSTSQAKLTVWISKDCGKVWNLRNEISGDELFTGGTTSGSEVYLPVLSEWVEVTVPLYLDIYLTEEFQVRFEFKSGGADAIYIDDINLQAAPVTGVQNPKVEPNGLHVFPNPTTGIVTVRYRDLNDPKSSIDVMDYTGRNLRNIDVRRGENNSVDIDLSGFPDGIYLVRVGNQLARVVKNR